jgi:DNA (cytosine-5)-methyltransferase 1
MKRQNIVSAKASGATPATASKTYKPDSLEAASATIVEEHQLSLGLAQAEAPIDAPDDSPFNIWDKHVKVEENLYYWRKEPVFTPADLPPAGPPTVAELFCGCGGTSLGFERAGFDVLVGVDIHMPSVETFRRNHPHSAAVLGDVKRVGPKALLEMLGGRRPNVLIGGIPCQGFSLN